MKTKTRAEKPLPKNRPSKRVGSGTLLGGSREIRAIQKALDSHDITTEPFCGRGHLASRVEWVLRRNAILEARCKEWAEKYTAAMALAEMEKKTKIERGEMVVELRTALEFYATAENYRLNGYPDGDRPIWADYGAKARAALGYSPNIQVSRTAGK